MVNVSALLSPPQATVNAAGVVIVNEKIASIIFSFDTSFYRISIRIFIL
ncbi:hypothetical protein [Spiroplasma clarkii]|nr:hypothetical protein [Spiroplasma clarkii]